MFIRDATTADAAACAAIYAPYVTDTAISFELEPPDTDAMAARIATATQEHAWLVAVDGERVLGYAYGSEFRSRRAYRFSCEVSVYLETGRRRTGSGRALYDALLARLTARGFRTALAAMTLPNDASLGLHTAMGFEPVGVFRRVGWKFDRWHDVAWAQRALGDDPEGPPDSGR